MLYGFAAMMGGCGTIWPGWWRHPDPDPEPWWRIVEVIIGMIGGIVAWVVFGRSVGDGGFVAMATVSFFGGVFLAGLANAVGIGAKKAGVTTAV